MSSRNAKYRLRQKADQIVVSTVVNQFDLAAALVYWGWISEADGLDRKKLEAAYGEAINDWLNGCSEVLNARDASLPLCRKPRHTVLDLDI